MYVNDSEQRRNKIFEYIIESYVTTASPVGSEFIAQKLRSSLSPATIRNIMVDLEQAGFLRQPHTSAGRVPTERGMRYYVDSVMQTRQLLPEQVRDLQARVLLQKAEDVDVFLARAAQVLADATQEAAFVVAPTVRSGSVQQIELVPIGARRILCVLVADDEVFASHVVEIEEPITRDETVALVRFFNTELVGLPFNDLLTFLERRLLAQTDSFYHVVKRSFEILEHALSTEPEERLYIEGTSHVLAQPEFRKQPELAERLLQAIEAEDAWLEQLRADLQSGRSLVRIGSETGIPGLEPCSYLTVPLIVGGSVAGGIGILGPVRMDYPRMRSFVEAMALCVREAVGRMETS